ncbi:MAG: polyprenyl synthetase family protein [Acidobacteriota bacterium]
MSQAQAIDFAAAFDSIRPRLALVERFIEEQLAAGPTTVQEVGRYVFEGGGKRLRPAMLLLVSRLLGYQGDRDIRYGAVTEMIHTATLVHDDIIDHAPVRRGRVTANNRWGNQLTVLIGDWLYTRSMELALEVGDVEVMVVLSRATIQMIEGEILALDLKGRSDITREQYLEITRRKTGELFAASCSVPALFDPAWRAFQEPLARYGRNLGLCFQLVDDLLDITATESRLGKPVFSDLREGTLTLPFILLLPRLAAAERATVERVMTTGRFDDTSPETLRGLLERHGTLIATRDAAREFGRQAVAALEALPASPQRDFLESAPALLVERDY